MNRRIRRARACGICVFSVGLGRGTVMCARRRPPFSPGASRGAGLFVFELGRRGALRRFDLAETNAEGVPGAREILQLSRIPERRANSLVFEDSPRFVFPAFRPNG